MTALPYRRSRVVGLLALLLVMVVPIAHRFDAEAATDLTIGGEAVVADAQGDNVNLRDEPSYAGSALTSVAEGDYVTVVDGPFTDDTDGTVWYQISSGDQTGYMLADYLSAADAVSAAAVMTTTANVNFRTGPGTGYSVMLVIPNGSTVNTTGAVQNGYTRLTYSGTTGWVASQYLSGSSEPTTATVFDGGLNLRTGPGTNYSVILVMPNGATVTITGALTNGYYPVTYNGTAGYASADFLRLSTIQSATTRANLNLRSGPGTSYSVLLVIPNGSAVTITGGLTNGFYPLTYNGTSGYASATYLQTGGGPTPVERTGYTTANLRLRSGPSTSFGTLLVMPNGSQITVTGEATGGYYPVTFDGTSGYASAFYITFTPPSGGLIVWPVSGGAWEVLQGYNGSSHQNESDLWQYLYSLDIARQDGQTAGVQVFAPVSGTVRWYERASGGITIDLGNGYAFAMFHLTVDRAWEPGDTIQQGDFIGTVSPPGGEGFQQVPHIHLTLWQTNDGGNWDRHAAPFTGQFAISGNSFPADGSAYQWSGFEFTP
ncbi:MAG TPA: SH3 domain-containing protein [Thermomicrobiales bacterium]|nr:SH3 domain-containing protein [Thermomicrobiales bacterium]